MSENSSSLIALMNGYQLILETIVRRLDVKGLLSKDDVANELSDLARVIEVDWKDAYTPLTPRLDVSVLRQLSNGLRDKQSLTTKWGYREHPIVDVPANDGTDPNEEP